MRFIVCKNSGEGVFHYEKDWLDNCPLSYAPIFYARYVDDIFVLLRSREHIEQLATYFSSQHPNINFTYEVEVDNCLPFLDVSVYRQASKFSSSVHRKDTFSGVFTNYESHLPEVYKKGLISTLLYRAYMINSTYMSLHDEVEKLKQIFKCNGYPMKFVDRCILKFFNKIHEKRIPVHTVPRKEITIVLPFLGTTSYDVQKKLGATIRQLLPFCQLKCVFKASSRMSAYFKYKDSFPISLRSGVIYKFTCAHCNESYIGCTQRYWNKRLEEHTHISSLTGKRLSGLQVFAPLQHVRKCSPQNPNIDRNNFEIIGQEKDKYLLWIKESILIRKYQPKINGNISSVPLYLLS